MVQCRSAESHGPRRRRGVSGRELPPSIGHVRITDATGRGDYDVDVNEIQVQQRMGTPVGTQWVTLRPVVHDTGWVRNEDTGATALYPCNPGGTPNVYRVRARYLWSVANRDDGYQYQWMNTSGFGC